ncbi:hypothetical protein AURDEDRAFT_177425 [Auricularia subglabra TFB-10046 SS5]|uniref:Uncharacterized protein n=1 Tax=Auricularia subglabra (strain TFB-10046 / SS5) TaxID=717982 RepID=J0LAQ6_AURST|nr:hypothetical protein AURDEDRAFT_177425 [Auricularia subglabra TFB-10046 SS5]
MAVVPTWSSNVLNHAGCVLSTAGTGATHSGVAALRPSPLPAASLGKTRHVAPGSPSALARPQHDDFADSPAPALTMGSRYPAAYGRLPAVAPSQDGGGYMATRPAAPDPPCAPAPQNGVRAVWFAPMSTTDTGMMRSVGADPPVAPPPCQDGCSSSHVAPASTGTRRRIVPGSRLALARSQCNGTADLLRRRKDAGDLEGRIVELKKTNVQCLEMLANRPVKRSRLFK